MKIIKLILTILSVTLAIYVVYHSFLATFQPSRIGANQFAYDDFNVAIWHYGSVLYVLVLAYGMIRSRIWVVYQYLVGCALIVILFTFAFINNTKSDKLEFSDIVEVGILTVLFAGIGLVLHKMKKQGLLK